jgi:hypothetical protein
MGFVMRLDPQAVNDIYEAKKRERARLAQLPMVEKIKLVVAMQKRADALIRARGGPGREVWKIAE